MLLGQAAPRERWLQKNGSTGDLNWNIAGLGINGLKIEKGQNVHLRGVGERRWVMDKKDGLSIKNNVIQGVSGESNDFSGQFAGSAAGNTQATYTYGVSRTRRLTT